MPFFVLRLYSVKSGVQLGTQKRKVFAQHLQSLALHSNPRWSASLVRPDLPTCHGIRSIQTFLLSVFSTHLIGCVSSLLHPANIFCSVISSSPSEFTAFLQPSCRPAKSPASNPSTMHKSVPVAGGGRVRLFPTDLFAGLLCARSAISAADRPFLGMLPLLPRMEMAQRTKTSRGRELRCRSKPARNSNLRGSRIGAKEK